MSYEKQNFVNNQNLTADHLNHIENGIENLENNKSDKLYYVDSEKENGLTFHRDQMTPMMDEGTMITFNVDQIITLNTQTTYTINVEFDDGTIKTFNGRPTLMPLPNNEGTTAVMQIVIQNDNVLEAMIALMDNVEYTAEGSVVYNENGFAFGIMHEKAAQFKSFTLIGPSQLEVNNDFFNEYKFVTENEKNYWDNKANKEDLYYDTRVMEEEPIVITFDGNPEGKESVVIGQLSDGSSALLVKASDYCDNCELMGINFEMKMEAGGQSQAMNYADMYGASVQEMMALIAINENYCTVMGSLFIVYNDNTIVSSELTGAEGLVLNKGVWFTYENVASEGYKVYVSGLYLYNKKSGNIKKIDNKFIDYPFSVPYGSIVTYKDENNNTVTATASNNAEAFNGETNAAIGMYSHAEGCDTVAIGEDAHAEGYRTIARGHESHAEGFYTVANGQYQHVQGKYNIIDNNNKYAHIVGNGTDRNKRSNAHALDWYGNAWFAGSITANGTIYENNVPLVDKYSPKLFYDDRKYEEIIYSFDGDFSNKETYSVSSTTFVKISDIDRPLSKEDFIDYDIKVKEYTNGQLTDEQWMSDSLGKDQMASYIFDMEGIPGAFSIAEYVIFVPTDVSIPGFPFSKGIWFMHISMGSDSVFVSDLKLNKCISGELKQIDNKFINLEYKVAGKTFTLEDGTQVTAGMGAEAFNNYGSNAVNNIATGAVSHAEGGSTIATGTGAHAEGTVTIANGYASHAEGWQTIASGEDQHVQGHWNIEDKDSIYAHIVGNGTYQNGVAKRSNAHTLDWSGNAWFAGKVTANGTPSAANDLVTKQYVDALAVNNAIMNIAHIEEIDALVEENNINVLDYKYQRVEMFNNANIILPEVDAFTKVHLYFDATEDLVINIPNCRKKQLPQILANKSYELIATYNMNYWLVEINVFE